MLRKTFFTENRAQAFAKTLREQGIEKVQVSSMKDYLNKNGYLYIVEWDPDQDPEED